MSEVTTDTTKIFRTQYSDDFNQVCAAFHEVESTHDEKPPPIPKPDNGKVNGKVNGKSWPTTTIINIRKFLNLH